MIGQLAITGLQVAKAVSDYNQSKSQARAIREQGKQAAATRAQEIRALAAEQRVSYLASGLELEGTPTSVINDTYNTGLEDIKAINSNTRTQMKNTLKQGQASLLGGLASAGASMYDMYSGLNNADDTLPKTKRTLKFK
ncbi:MAG: hypothetical protein IIW11_06720 [Bacteroidales bacterium]|nr:hypothetical protein [Bacteroidales bacterium]